MKKWTISRIDRFMRSFLWRWQHPDQINGGHYLVNW
jgi:hypothetical protein